MLGSIAGGPAPEYDGFVKLSFLDKIVAHSLRDTASALLQDTRS